jgi:hypothetical protein
MGNSASSGSEIGVASAATNFVFTNSNGFTGTVSTATTTPTLTLSHSGGRVLLNETIISSSVASVTFTSLITSQYSTYILEFENLFPVGNLSYPCIQLSQDNGSTWLTSYIGESWGHEGGSNTAANRSLAAYTGIVMQPTPWGCPNEATKPNSPANGSVKFHNPSSTTGFKYINGEIIHDYQAGVNYSMRTLFSGAANTVGAINAIKFYFDSGVSIAKGSFRLYGY